MSEWRQAFLRGLEEGFEKGYEAATPRWIPVEERLPETRVFVLLATRNMIALGWINEEGLWHNRSGRLWLVTHWQTLPPLPEPA